LIVATQLPGIPHVRQRMSSVVALTKAGSSTSAEQLMQFLAGGGFFSPGWGFVEGIQGSAGADGFPEAVVSSFGFLGDGRAFCFGCAFRLPTV